MAWRFHAMNLPTRTWVHRDLPLRDAKVGPAVSGPYQITGTLAPDQADLIGADGLPLLAEWSTLILAEEGDVLRGGGIVTAMDTTGPTLDLTATGFTAYPPGQPLVSDLVWGGPTAGTTGTGADPADVIRALWAHLQGLPGGDLGVQIDATATPYRVGAWYNAAKLPTDTEPDPDPAEIEPEIPIDQVPPPGYTKPRPARGKQVYWQYALRHYDNVDVGAKIEELAKQAPLDWREEYAWADADKTDVVLRLRLGHPRLGRPRPDLVFVEGDNVTELVGIRRDAGDYANVIVARGAGEGPAQLTQTVSRGDGRLRRARALDRGEATTAAALRALGAEELLRSTQLDDITSFTLDGSHSNAPLGSFEPGDDVFVQTHTGWRTAGVWVRVTALDYTPGDQRPTVTVTCARSDSFDYSGGN
jgi:hypothetical protein